MHALLQEGKIAPGSIVTLARSSVGLAVPKGAAKPDISSIDAFRQSLLAAKSIAYPDPAVGAAVGIHFRSVIEQMEVLATPGYDLVGLLPSELQDYDRFTWAVGMSVTATQAEAAKALIQFLSSPAAALVIKAKGMEPG